VRRDAQEKIVRDAGAQEVVVGDLLDAGAIARLTDDVGAIYHICPNVSPDEVEIGRMLLDAARQAGVERFVFHSVLHPQTEAMPHHWRKLRVEEALFTSGLAYTVLQPAPYMQNVHAYWERALREGVYPVPYASTARVTMVDLEDVAEVAARVLMDDGHLGATYELCGPENFDATEVASGLGEGLGRTVRARFVPREVWQAEARAAGLDEQRCETLLAMFRYYERHGLEGNPSVLRWLLGRQPTSFRQFVERTAAGLR
jgi:NAD(P)H dehydrogenase (quinone)